jgi:hypothetical protein
MMTDQELIELKNEIIRLKNDLYEKVRKLEDNCQHEKMKKETDIINMDSFVEEKIFIYTCLYCRKKWEFKEANIKFETRI